MLPDPLGLLGSAIDDLAHPLQISITLPEEGETVGET
jgi:hypothetical protein